MIFCLKRRCGFNESAAPYSFMIKTIIFDSKLSFSMKNTPYIFSFAEIIEKSAKNTALLMARYREYRKGVIAMKDRIWRIINKIAKGMIYGNMLICNGGGAYIDNTLLRES